MAAADQIKKLIQSFGERDDERFFSTSMQIAASEARMGHTNFAQELKSLIVKAKQDRNNAALVTSKVIPISSESRELSELIDVLHPKIKIKDMVLNIDLKIALCNFIREQNKSELLYRNHLTPQRKLLLMGPPGAGKTMTAQDLAGELNIPLFVIRLDGLISKYMGESISKLRLIFDTMLKQRAVYLFDEFDSIGSQREQSMEVGEMKRVLNSFLVNIERDESHSIIVAATNLPEILDKALFRRFDSVLHFPLPQIPEIYQVLENTLKLYSVTIEFDLRDIASTCMGLNYSDLVRSCEEAVKLTIMSGKTHVVREDFMLALNKRKL